MAPKLLPGEFAEPRRHDYSEHRHMLFCLIRSPKFQEDRTEDAYFTTEEFCKTWTGRSEADAFKLQDILYKEPNLTVEQAAERL